ncbi:hypothetical protein BDA99DRAFT_504108, partial [Phascolomyces articulosus]
LYIHVLYYLSLIYSCIILSLSQQHFIIIPHYSHLYCYPIHSTIDIAILWSFFLYLLYMYYIFYI